MSTQSGIELDKKGNPRKYQTGDVINGTVIKHVIDIIDIPDDMTVEEYLKEKGIDPKEMTLEKNWEAKEFVYKYPLSEEDTKKESDRLKKDLDKISKEIKDKDKIEYITPFKYRFKLDKKLVDKEEGKYRITYRGTKMLLNSLSVQWEENERITRKIFDKIISGTEGIIEDSIKGDFRNEGDYSPDPKTLKPRVGAVRHLYELIDKESEKKVKEDGYTVPRSFVGGIKKLPDYLKAEIFSESKYYTPDISEFHVGFEYEIKEPHRWIDRDYKQHRDYTWNKQIFEPITFDTEIETMDGEMPFECGFSEGIIRVKHLDGKDIKSLGFLQNGTWEWSYTSKDGNIDLTYTTNFSNKGKEIFISIATPYEDEAGIEIKFSGYIKNKSELKRLLKQLNIE